MKIVLKISLGRCRNRFLFPRALSRASREMVARLLTPKYATSPFARGCSSGCRRGHCPLFSAPISPESNDAKTFIHGVPFSLKLPMNTKMLPARDVLWCVAMIQLCWNMMLGKCTVALFSCKVFEYARLHTGRAAVESVEWLPLIP